MYPSTVKLLKKISLISGLLQITGIILLCVIKDIDPKFEPMSWAIIAISGFAGIIQVFTDERQTTAGNLAGFIGAGLIVVALQSLIIS